MIPAIRAWKSPSASTHFALAMVQLAESAPLPELAAVRRAFHLPPTFEFKYYTSKSRQKAAFFQSIQPIPFRVRAVVIDKSRLDARFASMRGQDVMVELIARLTLRASGLDIANDVLIIDGATPALCRSLRIRLSQDQAARRQGAEQRRVEDGRETVNGKTKETHKIQTGSGPTTTPEQRAI
jgi:hypothetical protein